jgi:hypothetical protein
MLRQSLVGMVKARSLLLEEVCPEDTAIPGNLHGAAPRKRIAIGAKWRRIHSLFARAAGSASMQRT